jgi:uncharacterized protein (UPF0218 family)
LGALRLPEHLREELSKIYGTLLTDEPSLNVKTVLKHIKSKPPPKVTIVGDFTLHAFLKAGYRPDLGIFDNKTKRTAFIINESPTVCVPNPAGLITDEATLAIRQALSSDSQNMLLIKGEEDLLSLVAIMGSPDGSLVIYGLPDRGMVVVTVQKEIKEKIGMLVSQFSRTS